MPSYPSGFAEIGRALVSGDKVFVNKVYATVDRFLTYMLANGAASSASLAATDAAVAGLASSKQDVVTAGAGMTKTGATLDVVGDATMTVGADVLGVANNGITDAKIRQSAGVSVIGRSANSTGNVADIPAGADDRLLARTGGVLGFVQATIGMFADGLLTRAKLANATGQSVIGRAATGTGAVADIAAGTDNRLLGQASGTLSFLRATLAMLADGTALSVIGRSANTSGVYADIVATNDGEVMRRSGTAIGFGTIVAAGIASSAVTMAKLAAWPSAVLVRTTGQSITSGAAAAVVVMTGDAYTPTGSSSAPTTNAGAGTITVNLTGIYRITARAGIMVAGSPVAGSGFVIAIRVGGTAVAAAACPTPATGSSPVIHATHLASLTSGNVVDMTVLQNTGASQTTLTGGEYQATLTVEYVGPAV